MFLGRVLAFLVLYVCCSYLTYSVFDSRPIITTPTMMLHAMVVDGFPEQRDSTCVNWPVPPYRVPCFLCPRLKNTPYFRKFLVNHQLAGPHCRLPGDVPHGDVHSPCDSPNPDVEGSCPCCAGLASRKVLLPPPPPPTPICLN